MSTLISRRNDRCQIVVKIAGFRSEKKHFPTWQIRIVNGVNVGEKTKRVVWGSVEEK